MHAARAFVIQKALNGRTRRVTIAPVGVLTLAQARVRAQEILAEFYRGVDPKAGRRQAITLRVAFASYLESNKRLSNSSRAFYTRIIGHIWATGSIRR